MLQVGGVGLVLKYQHRLPFVGTTDGQLCIQLTDLGLFGVTGGCIPVRPLSGAGRDYGAWWAHGIGHAPHARLPGYRGLGSVLGRGQAIDIPWLPGVRGGRSKGQGGASARAPQRSSPQKKLCFW